MKSVIAIFVLSAIIYFFPSDLINETVVKDDDCLKIGNIKCEGDSITGLPFFGTLYSVRLLDSFSTWDSNKRTFKMYIERLPAEPEQGKWYPIDDCTVEIVEFNWCIAWSSQGRPNEKDSAIIVQLKNKNK
jgi:hypothetical protein